MHFSRKSFVMGHGRNHLEKLRDGETDAIFEFYAEKYVKGDKIMKTVFSSQACVVNKVTIQDSLSI